MLDVVAAAHDSQKKSVRLGFKGEGKREVKVGYVVENPIWKTSYRLVMGTDNKPKLLGWANIENTSDEDWNNVKLTLVSSRPISFQMDLYPPLFIPRPVVEPALFATLRPQSYQGPLANFANNPGLGQFGLQGGAGFGGGIATNNITSGLIQQQQPGQQILQGGQQGLGQVGNLGISSASRVGSETVSTGIRIPLRFSKMPGSRTRNFKNEGTMITKTLQTTITGLVN